MNRKPTLKDRGDLGNAALDEREAGRGGVCFEWPKESNDPDHVDAWTESILRFEPLKNVIVNVGLCEAGSCVAVDNVIAFGEKIGAWEFLNLQTMSGVGPATADALSESGIHTIEELAAADVDAVGSALREAGIRKNAQKLIDDADESRS